MYSKKATIFKKFSHLALIFTHYCQNQVREFFKQCCLLRIHILILILSKIVQLKQVWDFPHIFWPSQKTSTLRERPPSSFHAHKGPLTHTVSHSHFENDNRLLLITIVQGFAHTFYRALFSVPYHVLKCKSKTNKKTGTKNLGWRLMRMMRDSFLSKWVGNRGI